MEYTAAQPAEWLPYQARRSFNLYELACLLHRQSPERLAHALCNERMAHDRATGVPLSQNLAARILSMVDTLPEQTMGDAMGGTLKALKIATCAPTIHIAVGKSEAMRLSAALGIEWPAELGDAPAEGSESEGGAALAPRHVPALRAQEGAILVVLRELGFDPQALPSPPRGHASQAKSSARQALKTWSDSVFEKAWKRLTGDGSIRYR